MIAGGNHTIIQQDGFLRGSAEFRTSPMPISLVTFLFGDKKVTEGVRRIPYAEWMIATSRASPMVWQ